MFADRSLQTSSEKMDTTNLPNAINPSQVLIADTLGRKVLDHQPRRRSRRINAATIDELNTPTFPFLKLPPEIRNEIYRYLLCTKYTKHLSESQRFKLHMLWPSHTYQFHTSILRTSRQIHHEAEYLARHENLFVLIRSKSSKLMDAVCRKSGLSRVDLEARALGHRVIDIEVGWVRGSSNRTLSSGPTIDYLICYDQLPLLCEGLLLFNGERTMTGLRLTVSIYVFGYPQDSKPASTTLPLSTQQQLLEPFKMLSYVRRCQISGPVSEGYKASIIQQVHRQDRSPEELFQKPASLINEGKNAFLESRFVCAVEKYESALKELLFSQGLLLSDSLIPDGEFAGYNYFDATQGYLHWKLPSNIAAAYLKLHQWQDAYNWASYALHNVGYSGHKERDFAIMLFGRALASKGLGEHERAGKEYREGKPFTDFRPTGVEVDREIDALRLSVTVPDSGYLMAALEETTV